MGNGPFDETPLLRHAVQHLRELLPSTWGIELFPEASKFPSWQQGRGGAPDLVVQSPAGHTVFTVEVRTGELGTKSAHKVVSDVRYLADGRPALLVTSFANPALRRVCEEAGVSYLDETGWVYLRADYSGLLVMHEGAKRSPASSEKRDSTISRLDGPGASAIIRSLWGTRLPVGVRALAGKALVSPGTTAKVLPSLASYGSIERDSTGSVTAVDRRLLLERWVQDYGFFTTNSEVYWFLAPRGPDSAYSRLRDVYDLLSDEAGSPLALTGYVAARTFLPRGVSPVVPHTLFSLYAEDPELIADVMSLKPSPRRSANVVIAKPRDAALLRPFLDSVPAPQLIADLMTMGSRFPELADQVFEVTSRADPLESSGDLYFS